MASAMPITATDDNHGYLVSIRIPSFTSSHDMFTKVLDTLHTQRRSESSGSSGVSEVREVRYGGSEHGAHCGGRCEGLVGPQSPHPEPFRTPEPRSPRPLDSCGAAVRRDPVLHVVAGRALDDGHFLRTGALTNVDVRPTCGHGRAGRQVQVCTFSGPAGASRSRRSPARSAWSGCSPACVRGCTWLRPGRWRPTTYPRPNWP